MAATCLDPLWWPGDTGGNMVGSDVVGAAMRSGVVGDTDSDAVGSEVVGPTDGDAVGSDGVRPRWRHGRIRGGQLGDGRSGG